MKPAILSRRAWLQRSAAAGMLGHCGGFAAGVPGDVPQGAGRSGATIASRWRPTSNIRDSLAREALRVTGRAASGLVRPKEWPRDSGARRAVLYEMMGIDAHWKEDRGVPASLVTGTIERKGYRIEKLYYESLPGLRVTANLYLPQGVSGRVPGVLYVCGHSRQQKVAFQAHGRRFAELGFACLIAETIQLGEVEGFHHGCYREGWWQWYSRGYTPAGVEMFNGMRGLDYLASRPEIDPGRLGVTGISGGGAATWWIAAGDVRVRAAAPVCGTATLYSHIHDRTVDGHCDCMWWINHQQWDLGDVGMLVAPRPLLIASADRDGIFTIESIRQVHSQLSRVYRRLGAPQNLRLVETPGGHSYHERSRREIFSWFLRHLMDREVRPESIADIDEAPAQQESPETLRVFVEGVPAGNRTATIQEDFVPRAPVPSIVNVDGLGRERARVVSALKRTTFASFDGRPGGLDVRREYAFEEDAAGCRFSFQSDADWRLHGELLVRKGTPVGAPGVLALKSPGEGRWETRSRVFRLPARWAGVMFEARGIGDTAWSEDLSWHVRRAAAWTGRTVASMRVWDVLRALAVVRSLGEVDPGQVSLMARGEMAAVALYAALLDGRVRSLVLEDLPASQDLPGQKDGRGPALEMLGCLRITDLPQVAGLLWPARLVLVGTVPSTYDWAEDLHRRLGSPGGVVRVKDLRDWDGG